MGLDIYSAFVIVITILMILVNLGGLMYWWSINLNAVSLVNLVMVSHILVILYYNLQLIILLILYETNACVEQLILGSGYFRGVLFPHNSFLRH